MLIFWTMPFLSEISLWKPIPRKLAGRTHEAETRYLSFMTSSTSRTAECNLGWETDKEGRGKYLTCSRLTLSVIRATRHHWSDWAASTSTAGMAVCQNPVIFNTLLQTSHLVEQMPSVSGGNLTWPHLLLWSCNAPTSAPLLRLGELYQLRNYSRSFTTEKVDMTQYLIFSQLKQWDLNLLPFLLITFLVPTRSNILNMQHFQTV